MQVNPSDFLCCADWDSVCPGTSKEARLDKKEGFKCIRPNFPNSSGFPIVAYLCF